MIDINIRGVFVATQAALKHMKSGGRIIMIGSAAGERVLTPGLVPYSATKGAVKMFAQALSREVGGRGITVNNVQPGPIDTDLNPAAGDWAVPQKAATGTRRAIEEARDSLQAQTEARRAVLVSLLAEVCRDYVELRTAQQRAAVAADNLKIARDSLALVQRLNAAGVVSNLDVTRAQAEVTVTAASLPAFDIEAKQSIHALGVLLGESPDTLLVELSPAGPIPQPPRKVPVGLPSDLLRRRPDVRRAERELAAATAAIGVAESDLYPKFTLTGDFGVGATDTSTLFNWSSRFVGIGPSARWLLLDAGRVLANVDSRRAVRAELLADYQQTILVAVRDVEDAVIAFQRDQDRRDLYRQTVDANAESVRIANDQYAKGITGFLTVLDAERSLFASQDALAVSDGTISLDLVALYKGLGGGWESLEKQAPNTPKFPRPPMPAAGLVER